MTCADEAAHGDRRRPNRVNGASGHAAGHDGAGAAAIARRPHSVVLSVMADTAADLAGELHMLAERIARGNVSNGRVAKERTDMTFVYVHHRETQSAGLRAEQPDRARSILHHGQG